MKLQLSRVFSAFLGFIFACLMAVGCLPDNEDGFLIEEETRQKNISIEEVKAKYNEIVNGQITHRQEQDMSLYWELGIFKELEDEDVLFFPVKPNVGTFIGIGEEGSNMPLGGTAFAFAHKDEGGEVLLELYEPVRTAPGSAFTGYILVRDWQEQVKHALIYDEGVYTGAVAVASDASTKHGDTQSKMECVEIIYTYYQGVEVGGGYYSGGSWSESYFYCFSSDPINLDGNDPSNLVLEGGGAGSGNQEGNLCPHPFIEGMYVDCSQLVCDSGQVLDENLNCVELPCAGSPCCDENGNLIEECENDRPCPDNPLKNMEITSPGASGKNGGRHGWTRQKWDPDEEKYVPKFHNGLDITATLGTYVFSPFSGKVVGVRNSFEPNQYLSDSYGNYVIVESTSSSGETFRFQYAHLDYVNVEVGHTIDPGMILGRSGTTGNMGNATPHLHIKATKKNGNSWQSTNPENYLKTKYNNDGEVETDPCEN